MIITIDGPAASGKSTVARTLANRLHIYYLYTGLLYRGLAYLLKHKNLMDLKPRSLDETISSMRYVYEDGKAHILFKGRDITRESLASCMDEYASQISARQEVRAALLSLQQSVALSHDVVADGRDCGTVVFPNADIKFFLTASIAARAQRYAQDATRHESGMSPQKAQEELERRDKRDEERDIAPLIPAKDAIIIDNSELNKEETINLFLKEVKKVLSARF